MEIKDKVAVITVAGGPGCGRAIAERLAREGAIVVVSDIDEDGGQRRARSAAPDGVLGGGVCSAIGVPAPTPLRPSEPVIAGGPTGLHRGRDLGALT
jgi:NAD(P)-dependent dehydrogenase (short-subunit alcohol dehydrogenase family)